MRSNPGQAAGSEFDPATQAIMPSREVTRVHLLRHGEVEQLERRAVGGQLDLPLSEDGHLHSQRLAQWLVRREAAPDRILSSDLQRCSILGQMLAEALGKPLELCTELREQNMGQWQGHTWEEITRKDAARVTAYWDDYVATRPPEGESLADLAQRVGRWWDGVLGESRGHTIVVVTHVGVIRTLLCRFLGIPTADALRFAPATASHTSVLCSGAGAVLGTFGERPWLD